MNELEEKIFLEGLPFQRKQTKLQKIDEVDHESFISATGQSAAAEYNQKSRKREERKSQVEINLEGIDFTDNSPEGRKSELRPVEGFVEKVRVPGPTSQPASSLASEETLSDGHFDDMKGTFMNHLKVIERE